MHQKLVPSICRVVGRDTCVFPGEVISFTPDHHFEEGEYLALEPRTLSKSYPLNHWPEPQVVRMSNNCVSLRNTTSEPVLLYKNDQVCHVRTCKTLDNQQTSIPLPKTSIVPVQQVTRNSKNVIVDPSNQLSESCREAFIKLNAEYDNVFEPVIGRYNDLSGKVRARINISVNKPPTRKLQVPQYCHKDLELLQEKFDGLEHQGVFIRPEEYGIEIEHVSPSFLVRKASGQGYRLVTSFVALGPYCKVLPATMPTVESVLRVIASWRYIIVTDLRDAFYQIPLDCKSMKWCGTPTPFRGLRCYAVAAQGMPGASEALEECMSTVFGEEVKERSVAKIADDMLVGAENEDALLSNWRKVLHKLCLNGITLKDVKTTIAPVHTQVLGWDWCQGKLTASSHKIAALVSIKPPETVTKLRSFIGAFKFFNRVIPQSASYINELESSISGRQKNDKISWNEKLLLLLKSAQEALSKASSINLPRPEDQLIITHDGSTVGIGSILFLNRKRSLKIGAFFSAKLKDHQSRWYPCEIEALSIASSIRHFGPYIRESLQTTQILTDNKPCIQAWGKMIRGEFSTSARVASYMSTLAEYRVEVKHINGCRNLPSDFQSRNPPLCESSCCQICKFVEEASNVVVQSITVDEIMSGHVRVPYDNRAVWRKLQMECQDLSKVYNHLRNGTRPTNKRTKLTTVKRYLQNVTISSKDGLLIVMHSAPFLPPMELIVIPEHLIHGLLTSLHLKLNHPTTLQLSKVFKRQFFALKSDHYAKLVGENCELCRSLVKLPKEYHPQSTVDIPASPCKSFAADVIRRFRQKIFVLRETFSSFTITSLISGEDHCILRSALIQTISLIRPNPQSSALVRVDNAPGFVALHKDVQLGKLNIFLDDGRRHNPNKNPVVDKGIQELISEILKFTEEAGPVTAEILAVVTNQLNSRIRGRGLTSWEILHQRDHNTGQQLDLDDKSLANLQEKTRITNQISSAKNKSGGGHVAEPAKIVPGSLVYIKGDGDKTRGRDRYFVVRVSDNDCVLKKLVKSQIMQKEHHLKLTEVMLVTPNTECRVDYARGFDSSDDDVEECHDTKQQQLAIPADTSISAATGTSDHVPELPNIDSNISSGPATARELPEVPSPDSRLSIVDETVNMDSELDATLPYAIGEVTDRPQRQRKLPGYLQDYDLSEGRKKK